LFVVLLELKLEIGVEIFVERLEEEEGVLEA
jgi:hypothetical protein